MAFNFQLRSNFGRLIFSMTKPFNIHAITTLNMEKMSENRDQIALKNALRQVQFKFDGWQLYLQTFVNIVDETATGDSCVAYAIVEYVGILHISYIKKSGQRKRRSNKGTHRISWKLPRWLHSRCTPKTYFTNANKLQFPPHCMCKQSTVSIYCRRHMTTKGTADKVWRYE